MSRINQLAIFTILLLLLIAAYARAQRPEVYVQHGPDNASEMLVSPDGKFLITGDRNGEAVRFYDLENQRELRTVHHLRLQSIALSPGGEWLVTAGDEEKEELQTGSFGTYLTVHTLRLWKVSTGEMVRVIAKRFDTFSRVVFSPDGRSLVTSAPAHQVALIDPTGATAPRTIDTKVNVNVLGFTPDGSSLVAHDVNQGTIRLFDPATGQQQKVLEGHTKTIIAIAISPDGRSMASSAWDKTIRVWDLTTGKTRQTRSVGRVVDALTFVNGGDELWSVQTGLVQRWQVSSGKALDSFKEDSTGLSGARFSSDGQRLFTSRSQKITVIDLATKKAVAAFSNRAGQICALSFLEEVDPQTLLAEDYLETHVWDLKAAEYRGAVEGIRLCKAGPAILSRDGKRAARPDGNGIAILDPATGALVRRIETGQGYLAAVSLTFSPDGRLIAAAGMDGVTKIVEVDTGKIIASISHNLAPKPVEVVPGLSVTDPSSMFPRILSNAVFSPDGKILAGALTDQLAAPFVGLWEVASGREVGRLGGHDQTISALAFSPDGTRLASGDGQGVIKLWELPAGKLLGTMAGKQGAVAALLFAPKNRLLSGGDDSTLKIWELPSQAELLRMVSLGHAASDQEDGGWLAVTPDGLFDGSPSAWDQVLWRFSASLSDVAPVEVFLTEYFYPNLLAEILAGKRPRADRELSQRDRRQPNVSLTLTDASPANAPSGSKGDGTTSRTVTVRVNVTEAPGNGERPSGSGAQDVRLFRNGSLVQAWRGDVLKGKPGVTLEVALPIIAGENRLTAYAFNHDDVKSRDAKLIVTGADGLKRKGVAYIVAVGVNEYSNTQYNLKYAVADAQDFATEVRAKQETLGQYERIELVSLYDRDATKTNILRALTELKSKAQPEDAIIIYFAGHGVASGNRFYLVPHDLGYTGQRDKLDQAGLDTILAHGLSDEELQSAVEGIDAGRMLMVIDACNSGQALESEEKRRGPMNSKGLAQLAYEKGMYILTAAQSYQAALEASKLGHGYLTYALVEEGLKSTAADTAPKDGSVYLREWLDYATARVPAMQQEKLDQTKQTPPPATPEAKRLLLQQTVTFTNGEEQTDPAQRTLQRPRVFYRREAESQPLVVARP